jgi:hypothetical protein
MKRDPGMTIQSDQPTRRAILSIAEDRQAPRRELNTKLMASSRTRPQLKLGKSPPTFQHSEPDARLLPRHAFVGDYIASVGSAILVEPVDPFAFLGARASFDDGPVHFRDRPEPELLGQPTGRLACLRQQDDPRRRPVEPMHQTDVDVSWLLVSRSDVRRGQVDQARLARDVPLR